jgi:hypothetical protein
MDFLKSIISASLGKRLNVLRNPPLPDSLPAFDVRLKLKPKPYFLFKGGGSPGVLWMAGDRINGPHAG